MLKVIYVCDICGETIEPGKRVNIEAVKKDADAGIHEKLYERDYCPRCYEMVKQLMQSVGMEPPEAKPKKKPGRKKVEKIVEVMDVATEGGDTPGDTESEDIFDRLPPPDDIFVDVSGLASELADMGDCIGDEMEEPEPIYDPDGDLDSNIIGLISQGKTQRQIADILGVSQSTISYRWRKLNE